MIAVMVNDKSKFGIFVTSLLPLIIARLRRENNSRREERGETDV